MHDEPKPVVARDLERQCFVGKRSGGEEATFERKADPAKSVREIVSAADRTPMPRRLVLGGGPYERLRDAWLGRIAELEAQRDAARAVDADA